ncbi:Metallo-beta-lactamase superfamily protein [Marininema mesophilum]|uniref:Metallo-beta-lactamase superfamily protein n=1 Tax=Marininema mesophilum TaxID=1048340 RepID=A0A1H2VSJ3_9BACL|nr:MBL fold metallo-hydrolase [Marininema mesophilum]SDW71363.1 Metallo-beta-lactamase superfamily protein [Marininema mesophilum]
MYVHNALICTTCGVRYREEVKNRQHCPICEDERQYVHPLGQKWTTLAVMKEADFHNERTEVEPGLTEIVTKPGFAIGQRALLLQTESGNFLWDCITYLDNETIEWIEGQGGLQGIIVSHPHFYSNFSDWAEAFDCPVYLHEADQEWVMGPAERVQFWSGETLTLAPGVTAVRIGGHFEGSTILHWAEGADGEGAILTGDTVYITFGLNRVSFMYSFPNLLPLPPRELKRIRSILAEWNFANIHAAWSGKSIVGESRTIVEASISKYLELLES